MRQAIAGTWVYVTVLIFMVILIAYVTISINYANAYELSEEVIKVVEQYEGYNSNTRKRIDRILTNNVHASKGGCKKSTDHNEAVIGGIGESYDKQLNGGSYNYCIKKTKGNADGTTRYYYETTIFFSFSLPVLGDLFTFRIYGQTSGLRNVTDDVDTFKNIT